MRGFWAFAAAPINLALPDYRTYHLTHHRYAGTPNDPDLSFVAQYPVTRASLKRKFVRDVTGQTGLRDFRIGMGQFRIARQWP